MSYLFFFVVVVVVRRRERIYYYFFFVAARLLGDDVALLLCCAHRSNGANQIIIFDSNNIINNLEKRNADGSELGSEEVISLMVRLFFFHVGPLGVGDGGEFPAESSEESSFEFCGAVE